MKIIIIILTDKILISFSIFLVMKGENEEQQRLEQHASEERPE